MSTLNYLIHWLARIWLLSLTAYGLSLVLEAPFVFWLTALTFLLVGGHYFSDRLRLLAGLGYMSMTTIGAILVPLVNQNYALMLLGFATMGVLYVTHHLDNELFG